MASLFTIRAAGLLWGSSASQQPDAARPAFAWAYPALNAREPEANSSFVSDGNHICIQGPARHMTFMLSLLKSSVLGGMHANNRLEHSTCEDRGFDIVWMDEEGHAVDHCYPPAQLCYEEIWVDDPVFGEVNAGGLIEVMALERSIVNDLNDRATAWEDDSWFSLSCNCLDGSQMARENAHHSEEACEELSQDFLSSFESAGGHVCIEAPLRYASRALATLRSSAAAEVFGASQMEGISCADRGFTGEDSISEQSSCFPRATNFFHSAEEQAAHADVMSEAASAYKQQFDVQLEDIPEEVMHACNCVPGSPMYQDLSDEQEAHCDDPAVVSPVIAHWPQDSM